VADRPTRRDAWLVS